MSASEPILHSDPFMNSLDAIRALQPGDVIQMPNIDGTTCDLLYAEFTQRRIDGTLRFTYNPFTCVLTVADESQRGDVIGESNSV